MDSQLAPNFRSKEYWRSFFESRGGKGFEWYSETRDLLANLESALPPRGPAPLLVPGCGSSSLSSDLHAAGWKSVTSVDFDAGVVSDMTRAAGRGRAGLTYVVADVTRMPFPDAAFAACVDKGTLDALASDAGPEAAATAAAYLAELARVTAPGGAALFVSLLQAHVARALFRAAAAGGAWAAADVRPPGSTDLSSPLCAFVVVLRRAGGGGGAGGGALSVAVHAPLEWRPREPDDEGADAGAGARAGDDAATGAAARAATLPLATVSTVTLPRRQTAAAAGAADGAAEDEGLAALAGHLGEVRWSYETARALLGGASGVGSDGDAAYVELDLCAPVDAAGAAAAAAVGGRAPPPAAPPPLVVSPARAPPPQGTLARYGVTALDVPPLSAAKRADGQPQGVAQPREPRAAVLLVPLGREHEYAFASRAGQLALGRQAGVTRLLVVTLSRAWQWHGTPPARVRAELDAVVPALVPRRALAAPGGVPYLAVAEDLGRVEPVAAGESTASGAWVVEDVFDSGAGEAGAPAGGAAVRRLVFASNRGAVQTEVSLRPRDCNSGAGAPQFDRSDLAFEYHRGMAAAVALALARAPSPPPPRGVVALLGLGGGALASFLAAALPPGVRVVAVDVDAAMVDVATAHFGLAVEDDAGALGAPGAGTGAPAGGCARLDALDDAGLARALAPPARDAEGDSRAPAAAARVRVLVGDALTFVRRAAALVAASAAPPLLAVLVDVDAKARDVRAGLSFPPLQFVSRAWLHAAAGALGERGVLALNLGARARPLFAAAVAAIAREFPTGGTGTLRDGEEEDGEEGGGGGDAELNALVVGVAGGGAGGGAAALASVAAAREAGAVGGPLAALATELLPDVKWLVDGRV